MPRMYAYQTDQRFFAQIAGGMEEIGAAELEELGATEIVTVYRGIQFSADTAVLYRIAYQSRLISRLLAPLVRFRCDSESEITRIASGIAWERLFGVEHTFAISASLANSRITHSKYAALCFKDGIVDRFRERLGRRPSVELRNADVRMHLHIEKNRAEMSWDLASGALHKRGYRKASGSTPMQETLAAAIIRFSGWDGSKPLYDPMCGSGTLLLEAAMQYARIPAGFFRSRFGFEFLPDYAPAVWQEVKDSAAVKIRSLPDKRIAGSDRDKSAVAATKTNLRQFRNMISFRIKQFDFDKIPDLENTLIVCNPPYGHRTGDKDEVAEMYKRFGDFLKQKCRGSEAYLYFGDRTLIGAIGLKPSWKKPLPNAALDGRLAKFEMY